MRQLSRVLFGAALLLTFATPALAGSRFFRQTTAKDFEEGEAIGTMILPSGEVIVGRRTVRLPLEVAFVWCGVTSADGAVTYFGTGDAGQIYAVDTAAAKGGDERKPRKVADLDAPWVTALALRADGSLLAGTTPGGRIYAVDPKTGTARLLAAVNAEHVWSLVHDAKTGITYAGTGSPGRIVAIEPSGAVRQIWDSGDKHVVSLAQGADGKLLAGTSEQAVLYRVGLDGRAEAVQDFDAEEVRAVARQDHSTYIAVNDFEKPATTPVQPPGPPAAKGTKIVLSTAGAPSSAGALPRPGQRKSKAAVYRLDRDGRMEQLFSIPDGYFTALAPDGEGGVFVSTGTQGRVYRVLPDGAVALMVDLPERQALSLVRVGANLLVGTGDVGSVYRAQPSTGAGASYLSKVLDAEFPSRWGMLRWYGTKDLGFETRSGNTAKPDASWSPWRKLQPRLTAQEGAAAHIESPPARYVQYRVGLHDANGRLREVTLHYQPQNQRARVTEFTLGDAPPAASGAATTTTTAAVTTAPRTHSPVLKLRWKTDNPDGDTLVYRVAFRGVNDAVWHAVGGPEPLSKPELDWNTEGIPDGRYQVRITTSDERDHPADQALSSVFVSPPLLVDNRRPEVLGLEAKGAFVTGRARDSASNVTDLEYSVDGGEWRLVAPVDGIFDDLVEAFSFRLPPLGPGSHSLSVRAWDAADNVGAAQITVPGAR